MLDARKFLSEEEQGKAAYAITQAEKATGGEILVVVATESGRYDRAEALCGLFFSLIALGLLHILTVSAEGPGSWAAAAADISLQSAAVVLGFVFGNFLATYVHSIRWLFVSREEMAAEVARAANQVYLMQNLHKPANQSTLVLYLSLFERRLVVLPGQALGDSIGPSLADEVCAQTRQHLRSNRRLVAIESAVALIGKRLAEVLPPSGETEHQLPNHLVLIHPRP